MNRRILMLAATGLVSLAACGSDKAGESSAATSEPTAAVQPPSNGDWSTIVSQTTAGGFMMGNPEAPVKLIEFGSMTCPHCAEFDESGLQPLIDNYVKSGKVAFEFRNFVRDGMDMAASLVARCNGPQSFFPMTRALFADQRGWMGKIQAAPQQQLEALQNLPANQQTGQLARLAGFQQFASMRGVPEAKANACLANQDETARLVQMNSDATTQFPDFKGTPTFVLNGKMLDNAGTWQTLEPQIKEAVGS